MHDPIHSKEGCMGPRASQGTKDERDFLQLTGSEPAVLATVPTQTSLSPIHTRLHLKHYILSPYGGVTPCSTLSWEPNSSSACNRTKNTVYHVSRPPHSHNPIQMIRFHNLLTHLVKTHFNIHLHPSLSPRISHHTMYSFLFWHHVRC
jgi:hypothetical protein